MKKILTCAALSIFLLSACSVNKSGIIQVNDKIITKSQFEKALDKEIDNSMFKNFGGASNFVKSDENFMYSVFKEKVVKELIIKSLLDSEIEKRGIKVTDEDIKAEMKSIVDKVGSKDELNSLLKQRGVSSSEFTEDLKTQIRIKKLISSISDIKITDADAEKYYKNNPDKFKHQEQVRASHILISSDLLQLIRDIKAKDKNISATDLNAKVEKIQAEQKAKAEAILKEVKANPDSFAKIAREKSEDKASGERGGELGFFSADAMVPEFSKAAFSMKPNTISENLVKTSYGYHIIKVTDRIEAGTTPYTKVKEDIKFYLETQEQVKVLKNFTDGLMKSAKIIYIDETYNTDKQLKVKVKEEAQNNKK
ncbi:peptidylprolyl isomerase [bacterium]|nr:peptidylprolyl isomerase [bacterium]